MAENHKYVTLTTDNFKSEVLDSTVPVLVDFWAPWCGPCQAVGPIIEQLADEFDGFAKIGKVNVDEEALLAAGFKIRSIPTLLFFKNGEVVDHEIGAAPKSVLERKLRGLTDSNTATA